MEQNDEVKSILKSWLDKGIDSAGQGIDTLIGEYLPRSAYAMPEQATAFQPGAVVDAVRGAPQQAANFIDNKVKDFIQPGVDLGVNTMIGAMQGMSQPMTEHPIGKAMIGGSAAINQGQNFIDNYPDAFMGRAKDMASDPAGYARELLAPILKKERGALTDEDIERMQIQGGITSQ